jgi:CheY-like chemotaxis protein
MSSVPVRQSVLVVSNSATETTLVQSILRGEIEDVVASADLDAAPGIFRELQAPVLVLAFRDLHKAEHFYLGLHRQGRDAKFQVHPHRAIVLCGKDEVRAAAELCRTGLVDDYVQFWPMTYDAPRLPLAVHRALQECKDQSGSSQSAAAFAMQARQLAQLEEHLSRSLAAGAGHAAATGEAVVKAEASIGRAMDGLAAQMLASGSVALIPGSDAQALARQVAAFSGGSVFPQLRDVSSTIGPLNAWIGSVGSAMEPHMKNTRALLEMAAQVRQCVLVVDDDDFQRQISGRILDSEGYQVKYAGNGGEALSLLSKMRPDLILMDVLMPDMTGLEVIQRIKSEPSMASVPVIMVTGKAERDVVVDSARLGAADFIVKPVERQTLLEKIARLLAPAARPQR